MIWGEVIRGHNVDRRHSRYQHRRHVLVTLKFAFNPSQSPRQMSTQGADLIMSVPDDFPFINAALGRENLEVLC
jgi:hypothetical protein